MYNATVVAQPEAEAALLLTGPSTPKKDKPEVKFIHLRNHRYDPAMEAPVKATILEPKGGVTIAYIRDGKDIAYYFAKCNPRDVFSKRIGRAVAQGRLTGGFGDLLEVDKDATRSQVTQALVQAYYEHEVTWLQQVELFHY